MLWFTSGSKLNKSAPIGYKPWTPNAHLPGLAFNLLIKISTFYEIQMDEIKFKFYILSHLWNIFVMVWEIIEIKPLSMELEKKYAIIMKRI